MDMNMMIKNRTGSMSPIGDNQNMADIKFRLMDLKSRKDTFSKELDGPNRAEALNAIKKIDEELQSLQMIGK